LLNNSFRYNRQTLIEHHGLLSLIDQMKKILLLLYWVFITTTSYAQKDDFIWLNGTYVDSPIYGYTNGTKLDFNTEPPTMSKELLERYSSFFYTMMAQCDTAGKLLFYSNGMRMVNSDYKLMMNGDSINPGTQWDIWWNGGIPPAVGGYNASQGMISLSYPGSDKYLVVHQAWHNNLQEIKGTHRSYTYLTEIDTKDNKQVVKYKNKLINGSLRQSQFTACRAADGASWILGMFVLDTKEHQMVGIDNDGEVVSLSKFKFNHPYFQGCCIGPSHFNNIGDAYFSLEFLADTLGAPCKLWRYDFDRCSGLLSNERSYDVGEANAFSLSTSHDGKFLYYSVGRKLMQMELATEDIVEVGNDNGTKCGDFGNGFAVSQLGPDGRLYLSTNGGSDCMSVVDYPYKKGKACGMRLYGIKYPTPLNVWPGMPNNPNYRLGPIDGSPCDSLGIDNIPEARFRKSSGTDTIIFTDLSYGEPDEWYWEFGDGSTSNERFPEHVYSTSGIYNVCLTVTNENGSSSTCQDVKTAVYELTEDKSGMLSIFPNPAKDHVSFGSNTLSWEAFPATMNMYDILGRLVLSQPIQYATDVVDISALGAGVYTWSLDKNNRIYGQGKLVVER